MDVSIFLAKAIGFFFIVMAIAMFAKEKKIKVMIKEVCSNPALMFLAGEINLVIGILIVLMHNVWVWDWRVLVTLVGWMCLIKGIVRTLFPHVAVRVMNNMTKKPANFQTAAVVVGVIGLILGYYGFVAGGGY